MPNYNATMADLPPQPPLRVAIRCDDAARAAGWRDALLAQLPNSVVIDGGAADGDADVLLVDGNSRDAAAAGSAASGVTQGPAAGLVCIGVNSPLADACLPTDFTPRELALACQLTATIARQRKQLDRATSDRRRWNRAALTDPLTGLPNRRAWDERSPALLAAAAERGQAVCLAIVDLDLFKPINDQHGHATGDRVLQTTAAALQRSLRHSDFLARIGGDEFALLLADLSSPSAAVIVERARAAVEPALFQANLPAISASAGLMVIEMGGQIGATPLEAADRALIRAKAAGRNRTVVGQ